MPYEKYSEKDVLPKGAVRLSEDEMLNKQWELLNNYYPVSEVFVLKYGSAILGGISAISGLILLRHFRAGLLLKSEGALTSYIPSAFFPAVGTGVCYEVLVQRRLLLGDYQCPVCLEMKATAVQAALGVGWPLVLSPIAAGMVAHKLNTLQMPRSMKNPVAMLKFLFSSIRPSGQLVARLCALNVASALIVTYFTGTQYHKFRARVSIREELARNPD